MAHSLNSSSSLSICIISADPQRALKNVVANPTFPSSLSSKITKIIGYTKLKARYHAFENRRELLSQHDVFLADDRIITRLPDALGKVFYKGTAKRPIPIHIAQENRVDGKRVRTDKLRASKEEKHASVASPAIVAREIEKALDSVPVSLKPGLNVSVRVGNTSFTPQHLSDNVTAVAQGVIEKHVVKGWRNVKSIHIKSPTSVAIPIWLADDMWVEDEKVVDRAQTEGLKLSSTRKDEKRKRKAELGTDVRGQTRKKLKAPPDAANDEDRLLAAARKAKLSQQKSQAMQEDIVVQ